MSSILILWLPRRNKCLFHQYADWSYQAFLSVIMPLSIKADFFGVLSSVL